MLPSEKPKFLAILNGLAAVKPGAKLTPEAYEVWWLAMSGWSLDEFQSAAAHLVKAMEFMPSPFHFEQLRKASRPTSAEAWLKAVAASGQSWTPHGFTGRASCGNPLIDKAISALGGYGVIAGCDTDKLHWFEKRFAEIYDDMQGAEDVRESVPMIAGPSQVKRAEGPKKLADLLPKLRDSA